MKELLSKIKEALISALSITAIVYLMSLTPWFDFSPNELISFSVGAVLLVLGIGFFNLGADLAMTPMGTHVGSGLSRQKRLGLLLSVCFALGVLITIAEPDLQVLAKQVAAVMNGTVLIVAVGVDVGVFLLIAVLKEVMNCLEDKFSTVKKGKGVSFAVPLSSIIGVNIYRFMSNNR